MATTADGWEPGGPWDVQAAVSREITEARHDLFPSGVLGAAYLASNPNAKNLKADLAAADEKLVALQRQVVQPHPYSFQLQRVETKEKAKKP